MTPKEKENLTAALVNLPLARLAPILAKITDSELVNAAWHRANQTGDRLRCQTLHRWLVQHRH